MKTFVRSSTHVRWRCSSRCLPECRKPGQQRPSPTSFQTISTQRHRHLLPFSHPASYHTRRKDATLTSDTIYALSTSAGRAAIAIVRISGPACLDIYGSLCSDKAFPAPRVATLRKLHDPQEPQRILDPGALILYFPAPYTVTGEDVLELHCHGGTAIVRSVLEAIARCSTAGRLRRKPSEYSPIRAAEAGEFTKRAFYNNRLDLIQAEGLGETLAAETEMQRRLAVESQSGGLAGRYEEWRQMLLEARGEMEALIDFSEDQHFDESPRELVQSVAKQAVTLKALIERHVLNARKGELLREGISVALLGPPNAGKSSLLNLIVGRDAAIVSAEAGTTRDIVDVSVDLNGWLVRLGDMAGLRGQSRPLTAMDEFNRALQQKVAATLGTEVAEALQQPIGAIEQEGIRRARARALESDVVVVLLPICLDIQGRTSISIDLELGNAIRECEAAKKEILFVLNKSDLITDGVPERTIGELRATIMSAFPDTEDTRIVDISCRNAAGANTSIQDPGNIQRLLTTLTSVFAEMTTATAPSLPGTDQSPAYWQSSLSISHRQSQYLVECLTHLNDFLQISLLPPPSPPAPDSESVVAAIEDRSSSASGPAYISIETDLDHYRPFSPPSSSSSSSHESSPASRSPVSDDNNNAELDIVLAAEHLRAAAACLAKITGRGAGGDVEDVLGVVFEKFCVGK